MTVNTNKCPAILCSSAASHGCFYGFIFENVSFYTKIYLCVCLYIWSFLNTKNCTDYTSNVFSSSCFGSESGYTLDGPSVCHRATIHTHSQFRLTSWPNKLISELWGQSQSTLREPTQAQGAHANATQNGLSWLPGVSSVTILTTASLCYQVQESQPDPHNERGRELLWHAQAFA